MKSIVLAAGAAALLAIAATCGSAASLHRELTPEERLIYMQQVRGQEWRALTLRQRCERRRQLRQQWAHMTPAEVQKLKQHLDARWNAMPAAERQRIEQRIAERRARPARSSGQRRHPACADLSAP